MSRTKAVHIFDRVVWTWDNSHDIVLAHLVEVAEGVGDVSPAVLESWRVWASIIDLAFTHPEPDSPDVESLCRLFRSGGGWGGVFGWVVELATPLVAAEVVPPRCAAGAPPSSRLDGADRDGSTTEHP